MNSMNMSFDSMKQNKKIEECDYDFDDIPQKPKQQNNQKKKNNYNKNKNNQKKKKEQVPNVMSQLDDFFKDVVIDEIKLEDEVQKPEVKKETTSGPKETNKTETKPQAEKRGPSHKDSKQDNEQERNHTDINKKWNENNKRERIERERKRDAQSFVPPEKIKAEKERQIREMEKERRIEEQKRRREEERNEDAKRRFMEADKKIKEREAKNDISGNKEDKKDIQKKEEKPSIFKETEEEGKYNIVADNSETIEDMNIVLFNKKIISDIREKIKEEGIDIIPLPETNNLPIVRIVKNPRQSFRMFFGKLVTFMVTGYKNDGHTERIYIEVIEAPSYVDKEDEDKSMDVKGIIQSVVRNEQINQDENYQISIVLSKNSKAEPIKDVKRIELKEMFAIDGVIAGVFIDPETNKKKIETNNEFPPSIIRHSYQYCNDILNGTAEKYSGGLGGYFRRQLKVNTTREAEVLEAEITYIAQKQKIDINIKILEALSHFNYQRRGENEF